MEVHPRGDFRLEAVDNSLSDINYFKYEVIDDKNVAIKLAHSLEDLVDRVRFATCTSFARRWQLFCLQACEYLPLICFTERTTECP